MSDAPAVERLEMTRWQRRSLAAGVLAAIACIVGAFFDPPQFFRAYLTAYLFYLGLGLGSMAILMIYHMTGGAWGFVIRRILEAGMRTLPLLAVLFIPIAVGIRYLYLWARPEMVGAHEELQYKQFYLNPTFFWIRAGVYFAVWLGIAGLLTWWSAKEDRSGNGRVALKTLNLSAVGAVAYGITLHFAAIDWLMSLEPSYHSSIFGPLVALGQLLSALALALIVLAWLAPRPPLAEVVSPGVLNDLGSLLFTLVCAWAYMVWFQFMLVWIANLPIDTVWFLRMAHGGWRPVAWSIFVLHFAVPFLLLLMRPIKQNRVATAWVATLILLMQLVFMYFQVMPAYHAQTLAEHWMDFLTPIAIGGLWLAWFLWQLGRWPLLPLADRNRQVALHLRERELEDMARAKELAHG